MINSQEGGKNTIEIKQRSSFFLLSKFCYRFHTTKGSKTTLETKITDVLVNQATTIGKREKEKEKDESCTIMEMM